MPTPRLEGPRVRLEPLTLAHLPALESVLLAPELAHTWRHFRDLLRTPADLRTWVETALTLEATGTGMPWVTILTSQDPTTPDRIVGSTRFIDLDRHNRTVEIGNTWLTPAVHGTHVNPEAKFLQLTYAFETLNIRRVALKSHHQNLQSQAAMRKLGAQYEGTFRNHMLMPDGSTRHSVWFSITAEEWPEVKLKLEQRITS